LVGGAAVVVPEGEEGAELYRYGGEGGGEGEGEIGGEE
jgi:hypothetical protein